jgi:hypothetical protein
VKVGWLVDPVEVPGGAEISLASIRRAAPPHVESVDCLPGHVPSGLDLYIAGNVVTYSLADTAALRSGPVVARIADWMPHTPPELRAWLLDRASLLVFLSPLHVDRFAYPFAAPHVICPSPVNLDRFRAARRSGGVGACYVGSMACWWSGVDAAVEWAAEHGPVDFYGDGPYRPQPSERVRPKGRVSQDDLPAVLARYERLVKLPQMAGSFDRTVVEAWAAGLKLTVNRNVGALHWIENDPAALEDAAGLFWGQVEERC